MRFDKTQTFGLLMVLSVAGLTLPVVEANCGDVTNNIETGPIHNDGGTVSIGNIDCSSPSPEDSVEELTVAPVDSPTPPVTDHEDEPTKILVAVFVAISIILGLVACLVILLVRRFCFSPRFAASDKTITSDTDHQDTTERGERNQAFLSHTGQDEHAATFTEFLSLYLTNQLSIPHFVDFACIPPGAKWKRTIEQNVQSCPVFVCILSESYLNRYWCMHELDIAIQAKKYIIPVLCNYKLPKSIEFEAFKRKHRANPHYTVTEEELNRWCENLRLLPEIQAVRNYSQGTKGTQSAFVEKVARGIKQGLDICGNPL